jgi:FkbM family methyltransferase
MLSAENQELKFISAMLSSLSIRILSIVRRKFRELLWAIGRSLNESITVASKQGRFAVSTKDLAIGRRLFVEEQYELRLMTNVVDLLVSLDIYDPRKAVMIDIGANIGVISIGLLSQKKYSFAIAIEPEPVNFRLLARNVEMNSMQDRFVLINKAASDCNGDLCLELSEENFGDHRVRSAGLQSSVAEKYAESGRKIIKINALQLDAILEEVNEDYLSKVGLVWIDVQGHEASVFTGGLRLLGSGCPVVSEVWPYGIRRSGCRLDEFASICSKIWSRFYRLEGDAWTDHSIEDLYGLLMVLDREDKHTNVVFIR